VKILHRVRPLLLAAAFGCFVAPSYCQEQHEHPAALKLGEVSFPVSCAPAMHQPFNQAVALLHSFAYSTAREQFLDIAAKDPKCAMARWGAAMTYYHQLWDPRIDPGDAERGQHEIETAARISGEPGREQGFVNALEIIFRDADKIPYGQRVQNYLTAMEAVSRANPADVESQVFYALALISAAAPDDRSHANQKKAADILRPLFEKYPDHPGMPHYLIHACDNAEMAQSGLGAARAYARIAPSAPHALHMPSHIFTQLGMWSDSIESNRAARVAAHEHGDVGEELHSMDYLVYAYLQSGRFDDAARVLTDLRAMGELRVASFKIDYASTAMPVRYAIERRDWRAASEIRANAKSAPQAQAIAYWGRAVGWARSGKPDTAEREIERLAEQVAQLRASNDPYWATQAEILMTEARAWTARAIGQKDEAKKLMREAADKEESVEKRPVTPGPIVPAREQLGDLLIELSEPEAALKEFQAVETFSPGRKNLTDGIAQARALIKRQKKISPEL
jgi:hypothetical protein